MATELVLENFGKLNIKEGTNFPLNFNIQDLTRPESTPSSYSKDVTIIGDKEANKILGQAFDVNISDSSFDINKKVGCNVLQDNATVFDGGYFQLLKVTKTGQSLPNGEPKIEYIGRVKSDLMSFFTDIKDKDLTDLKLGGFDTYEQLNKANILASFNNTVVDKWKYIPTFKVQNTNIFRINQWKPAIFAKTFWDEIHAQNGWQYEFDEIPDIRFDKLIIPYTGEFDADEEVKDFATVEASDSNFKQYNFLCKAGYAQYGVLGSNELDGGKPLVDTETKDNFNQFNPATSELTSNFNSTFKVRWEMDYEYILENPDTVNVELTGTSGDVLRITQGVQHRIGNAAFYTNQVQIASFVVGDTLSPGFNTVSSGTLIMETSITCDSGDVLEAFRTWQEWRNIVDASRRIDWRPVGLPNQIRAICGILNVTETRVSYVPDLEYNIGTPIYLNQFIPREIKQRDFVKSIIDMYKLVVDIDPTNDNKLIYKTRDKYYDDGRKVDWTRKIDKSRPINLEWLVDKQPKKVKFTYKQDEDVFNEAYYNHIKDIYGEFKYDFGNDYNIGTKNNEIIFSPTPIQHDAGSDMYLPSLPLSDIEDLNIRLLYDGGLRTAYWFLEDDDGTFPSANESDYPYFGHLDDPVQPSFDINFGTCEFYYYNSWEFTTDNNLFNLFHRRYISQLTKGRIMTAYFDLSPKDILTLKLNDKIFINDAWWNINKVIDYNANSNSSTKVELVTVDDGVSVLPTRKIGVYNPDTSKPYISSSYIESGRNESTSLNTINAGFVGEIYGEDNNVSKDAKGVIVGDNNTMGGESLIIGDRSSDGGYDGKAVVGNDLQSSSDYDITTNSIDVNDRVKVGDQIITASTIKSIGEVIYKARIEQSGNDAPVITEYINKGFTITPAYIAVGIFGLSGFTDELFNTASQDYQFNFATNINAGESAITDCDNNEAFLINTYGTDNNLKNGVLINGKGQRYHVITITKY